MKNVKTSRTTPRGVERKIKTDVTDSVLNNADAVIESTNVGQECPICYVVLFSENLVGGEEIMPTRMVGNRESLMFNNPNPFYARQEAVIYATGLAFLTENEHKLGGLKFDSPSVAESKGFRDFNCYSIQIFMVNLQDEDDLLMIYERPGIPSEDTLSSLDVEFNLLESMGYTTDKYFDVQSKGGQYFKCIESRTGLVKFDNPAPSESPEPFAAL